MDFGGYKTVGDNDSIELDAICAMWGMGGDLYRC